MAYNVKIFQFTNKHIPAYFQYRVSSLISDCYIHLIATLQEYLWSWLHTDWIYTDVAKSFWTPQENWHICLFNCRI